MPILKREWILPYEIIFRPSGLVVSSSFTISKHSSAAHFSKDTRDDKMKKKALCGFASRITYRESTISERTQQQTMGLPAARTEIYFLLVQAGDEVG